MWVEAGTVDELRRARKRVIDANGTPVVVVWHEDQVYALHDTCIHKQRELHKGVILHGRLVCPGHQWAYDLATGYCRERDRCQPVHSVRVEDGVVWVNSEAAPSEERTWLRTSS
jgi:nitrite reductase (NADH) small subunit